jgi:hypothetical protein
VIKDAQAATKFKHAFEAYQQRDTFAAMTNFPILIAQLGNRSGSSSFVPGQNSEELLMRRFLMILEGATIGLVVAYGVVGLWRDWKISQSPEAVVEQFEMHPVSPPEGLGI